MSPHRSLVSLFLIGALSAPNAALAWDPSESPALDAIDIRQIRREIVALRDGGPTVSIRLENGEQVVSLASRGRVAVALTDRRVLAVSRRNNWNEYRLRSEDGTPLAQLGGRIALVSTERRLLWLGAAGAFQVLRLGAGERLIRTEARENVAVAVTNRRAIGFAGARSVSSQRRLRAQERFHSLRVLGASGTVQTSKRLLVFSGSSGDWSAESISLR